MDPSFKQFIAKYPAKSYRRGETVLLKGERPAAMFVIESGFIKTYTITAQGNERLVSIEGKGEDFPIGFGLGLIEKSEFFYEAFSRCSVRLIPKEEYVAFMSTNLHGLYARHIRLTILLLTTLSRINALEQPGAGPKIGYTLLYMADQLGVVLRPYATRMKVSVTQQEIANALGLARETTSHELKKLESMKLIDHSRQSYIVYKERLKKYLDSQ